MHKRYTGYVRSMYQMICPVFNLSTGWHTPAASTPEGSRIVHAPYPTVLATPSSAVLSLKWDNRARTIPLNRVIALLRSAVAFLDEYAGLH